MPTRIRIPAPTLVTSDTSMRPANHLPILPILLLALLGASCGGSPGTGTEAFVAAPSPGFLHDNGYAQGYYFPETFGSGVALLDADEDGHLDLYAVQAGPVPGSTEAATYAGPLPTNQLFLGDGTGTLRDATTASGDAAHNGFGMGACVGDVNGDGHPDLFLTNVGADSLLLGTGNPAALFKQTAPGAFATSSWTTASGFADFDRDGHLDLVVIGYARWSAADHIDCIADGKNDYCDVKMYDGIQDHVYQGDGSGGFTDMSTAWAFGVIPSRGLGASLADYDDDGFDDIYVANDTDANRYYKNNAGAGFQDRTDLSGASSNLDGRYEAGMGVAMGDTTGDGLADIVVTNFTSESNNLYVNMERGRFRERSRLAGLAQASLPKLAFGVTLQDFDLNGSEDLFTACGHVLRHVEARTSTWSWRQSDQLMLKLDPKRFSEADPGEIFSTPRVGRGLAAGDLNEDGAPDLVVSNSGDELTIGLNNLAAQQSSPIAPRWLILKIEQRPSPTNSNTQSIGAKVTLEMQDGTKQTRWIRSGTGYLSQDDQRPHFGIPAPNEVLSLSIRWPDATTSIYTPKDLPSLGTLNQIIKIERK